MEQLKENKYTVNEVFELIHEALIVGQDKFICKNRPSLPQDILQAIREKMISSISILK